ncbi:hypothetical protein [Streptomyces odontomachi]|uniref:hypothetical protein n=1 Tax=Streptomyces odontomachi TaxID=2944940 RepID=UPI00210A8AA7|nr:hypothetical protein [Streptomyces sp. ODS25]
MRTTQIVVRSGLTAAAVALPLSLAYGPTAVAAGVSVSATGSTVRVSTSACSNGGNASLLSSGQAIFAQGRQATLSTTGSTQSASWSSVPSGAHTVIVMCSDGTTAGTGTVHVSTGNATTPVTTSPSATATTMPTTTPTMTASPTASPSLPVQGGVGGGSTDYGPLTAAIGGTLVAAAVGTSAWYLYRRRAHKRV